MSRVVKYQVPIFSKSTTFRVLYDFPWSKSLFSSPCTFLSLSPHQKVPIFSCTTLSTPPQVPLILSLPCKYPSQVLANFSDTLSNRIKYYPPPVLLKAPEVSTLNGILLRVWKLNLAIFQFPNIFTKKVAFSPFLVHFPPFFYQLRVYNSFATNISMTFRR